MKNTNTFYTGNGLEIIKSLPSESVNCCVTSPPYWGLRDYGLQVTDWPEVEYIPMAGLPSLKVSRWIGCLGLEPSPELYIAHIILIFREIHRVLRNDGTVWINLGDSYAKCGISGLGDPTIGERNLGGMKAIKKIIPQGLKPKDLVGIPWMVAFALQADSWYLRSDIIWSKSNPMPESVKDRPTKAHEYVFLLSKSSKYYYDSKAIEEPAKEWTGQAATFERDHGKATLLEIPGQKYSSHRPNKKQRESVKRGDFNGKTNDLPGREAFRAIVPTKNKRTVWTISTKPFKGAHFAVFPPDLVKPCILAGSRVGDTIIDPFGGSGTVALVASELGRDSVYIDLNSNYTEMAKKRTSALH